MNNEILIKIIAISIEQYNSAIEKKEIPSDMKPIDYYSADFIREGLEELIEELIAEDLMKKEKLAH
jgi:hypothetical protein